MGVFMDKIIHMFGTQRIVLFVMLLGWLQPVSGADGVNAGGGFPVFVSPELDSHNPPGAYQSQLLDLAFETASMIPLEPHIKDRSRAQEAVVAACLELGLPARASRFAAGAANWRRGSCLADIATYLAKHGHAEEARRLLAEAERLSRETDDWRADRVLVKISQARLWLGDAVDVRRIDGEVARSEKGKLDGVLAAAGGEEAFEERMEALERNFAAGGFDSAKNSLYACAKLYRRYFGNETRRGAVERRIRETWGAMPAFVRIDLAAELADAAVKHGAKGIAMAWIAEAKRIFEGHHWPLEHRIPLMAQLAGLRHRAGGAREALEEADEAMALFEARGGEIVNIWRAGALRPLAEAFAAMGYAERALAVYRRAVEEGVANPNSRPRAEDLSATCASMAVAGIEPDAALWARILEIQGNLASPW